MRDPIPCPTCGGFIDHDILTGEMTPCDVCGTTLPSTDQVIAELIRRGILIEEEE